MTENVCDKIPQEKLVAFADGQLSSNESAEVSEHITQCETCAAMVDALQRSIELVTASWAAEQAKWPKWQLPDKPGPKRWPMRRMTAVAAGILLVLGLGLIWRMLAEPVKPIPRDTTVAHLRQTVIRAGQAAQMLAVADLLARQPQGREYARNRYLEITKDYAGTECARQAKLRLKSF
jgi:anti-sigma factor RsiW